MPDLVFALSLSIALLLLVGLILLLYAFFLRAQTERKAELIRNKTPFWDERLTRWLEQEILTEPGEDLPKEFLEFLNRKCETFGEPELAKIRQLLIQMGLDAYLRTTIRKRSPYLKAWAAYQIGEFRIKLLQGEILPLLDYSHNLVSFSANLALAKLVKPQEQMFHILLTKLMTNYRRWTTEKLAEVVLLMGPAAGRHMLRLIETNQAKDKLCWFIIDISAEMGLPEAGPVLSNLLEHRQAGDQEQVQDQTRHRDHDQAEDQETVVHAIRALGKLVYLDALHPIEKLLQHPEWFIRAQAAKALGLLKCPESIPALTAALADSNWWVRNNAGEALFQMGTAGQGKLVEIARFSQDRFAMEMAQLIFQKRGGRSICTGTNGLTG